MENPIILAVALHDVGTSEGDTSSRDLGALMGISNKKNSQDFRLDDVMSIDKGGFRLHILRYLTEYSSRFTIIIPSKSTVHCPSMG